MISNNYSSARMWALTKHYAVENRRNILITLGVMFGIILLVSIFVSKTCASMDTITHTGNTTRFAMITVIYIFASGLIVQILGSLTFSSMSTKTKRISNIMLPAKQSEKFISQCLLYVVGGNIALLIILFLADIFSALIFGLTPTCFCFYTLPEFNSMMADITTELQLSPLSTIVILLSLFFIILWFFLINQAIFVLGSAWWPRKAFLKTFLAISVVQIVVPIFLPLKSIFSFIETYWYNHIEDSSVEDILIYGIILIAYVILAGVYFLAWQRYKRLEIVKRFLN